MKKDVWVVRTVVDTLYIHLVLPSSGAMVEYKFQQPVDGIARGFSLLCQYHDIEILR